MKLKVKYNPKSIGIKTQLNQSSFEYDYLLFNKWYLSSFKNGIQKKDTNNINFSIELPEIKIEYVLKRDDGLYVYRIKELSLGNKYKFIGFVKISKKHHLLIEFCNNLIPWFYKFDNWIKIFVIITALAASVDTYTSLKNKKYDKTIINNYIIQK